MSRRFPRIGGHHECDASFRAVEPSRPHILSVLPLRPGHDHRQVDDDRCVLALCRLRPNLEPGQAGSTASAWAGVTRHRRAVIVSDLRELVAALDRRVPRLEREGEPEIARDAAALKDEALLRIAELEQGACLMPNA